jgi:hypothetical protein
VGKDGAGPLSLRALCLVIAPALAGGHVSTEAWSASSCAPVWGGAEVSASWAGGLPERLDPAEEASPAALRLARRFNPSMALPNREGPWPVAVRYAWAGGSGLRARTVSRAGRILADRQVLAAHTLDQKSWGDLPQLDVSGNRIEYWVDVPGDDRREGGVSGWLRQWRRLVGENGRAFSPTQYAHLFWVDRERGLLAVQYWFFFPFNDWINNHEGDWEHVNILLRGPRRLASEHDFRPVGYEFYFHERRLDMAHPLPVDGVGDHPVVFVGGRGRVLWWSGNQSGGSYPLPAQFPGAGEGMGPLCASDDTRSPALHLPADAFDVILLPEPERLDTRARPELSWLRLPFYAGQAEVHHNPPFADRFGAGRSPPQPGRRRDWNAIATRPLWSGTPVLDQEWIWHASTGSDRLAVLRALPGGNSPRHP